MLAVHLSAIILRMYTVYLGILLWRLLPRTRGYSWTFPVSHLPESVANRITDRTRFQFAAIHTATIATLWGSLFMPLWRALQFSHVSSYGFSVPVTTWHDVYRRRDMICTDMSGLGLAALPIADMWLPLYVQFLLPHQVLVSYSSLVVFLHFFWLLKRKSYMIYSCIMGTPKV